MNDDITVRLPTPPRPGSQKRQRKEKTRITQEAETMARLKRLSRAELYSSTNNLHEKKKVGEKLYVKRDLKAF